MILDKKKLSSLLDRELAARGKAAAISNSVFGIFIFIYHFEAERFSFHIQGLAILTLLLSALRYFLSRKYLSGDQHLIGFLKINILAHSIVFGFISGLAVWELDFTGVNFSILVALVVGFTSGAIITLSYDRVLFNLHIGSILGTLTVLTALKEIIEGDPNGLRFAFIIIIYLIYLYMQYKTFHQETVKKLYYEEELELSNVEIKNSTEKLIQASRFEALGDMAQGLAHEINNSTMVILGSAQQVERELRKESILSQKNEKRIQNVVEAVLRMKVIIDGLKFFSQEIEKTDKVPTPLSQIIERTLQYAKEMLRAHHVALKVHPFSETIIPCQPFQITHILFNLLKNADEAMKKLPEDKRWIEFSAREDDHYIFFRVSNGGEKIPPEQRKKLFQPFYTTKEVNTGTGLSLSSARGLARDHGGEIYFDTEAEFTTFILKLPL